MDIRSQYGFHLLPFTREVRVDHLMALPAFTENLEAMTSVVERRMSAVVYGPSGTGKSVLLRAVAHALPEARYRCHYVKVTGLSKRDMCREIAQCMALPPAGAYNALFRRIQESARSTMDVDGLRPVLILDEAQDLRPDVLGMLAPLTNFDMDSRLVLSIVLAGQPPLVEKLKRPDLEGIARRIAHYAQIPLLSRDETAEYVAHRCAVAGCTRTPFDAHALDTIYELGRGNLRATDNLALKALERAAAKGADTVDHMHVLDARRSLWP